MYPVIRGLTSTASTAWSRPVNSSQSLISRSRTGATVTPGGGGGGGAPPPHAALINPRTTAIPATLAGMQFLHHGGFDPESCDTMHTKRLFTPHPNRRAPRRVPHSVDP